MTLLINGAWYRLLVYDVARGESNLQSSVAAAKKPIKFRMLIARELVLGLLRAGK